MSVMQGYNMDFDPRIDSIDLAMPSSTQYTYIIIGSMSFMIHGVRPIFCNLGGKYTQNVDFVTI